jgi:hypothetical protein
MCFSVQSPFFDPVDSLLDESLYYQVASAFITRRCESKSARSLLQLDIDALHAFRSRLCVEGTFSNPGTASISLIINRIDGSNEERRRS